MTGGYNKPKESPRDPDELMTGTCRTCKTVTAVRRRDTFPARETLIRDLPTTGCPKCGAVVELIPKPNPVRTVVQEEYGDSQ